MPTNDASAPRPARRSLGRGPGTTTPSPAPAPAVPGPDHEASAPGHEQEPGPGYEQEQGSAYEPGHGPGYEQEQGSAYEPGHESSDGDHGTSVAAGPQPPPAEESGGAAPAPRDGDPSGHGSEEGHEERRVETSAERDPSASGAAGVTTAAVTAAPIAEPPAPVAEPPAPGVPEEPVSVRGRVPTGDETGDGLSAGEVGGYDEPSADAASEGGEAPARATYGALSGEASVRGSAALMPGDASQDGAEPFGTAEEAPPVAAPDVTGPATPGASVVPRSAALAAPADSPGTGTGTGTGTETEAVGEASATEDGQRDDVVHPSVEERARTDAPGSTATRQGTGAQPGADVQPGAEELPGAGERTGAASPDSVAAQRGGSDAVSGGAAQHGGDVPHAGTHAAGVGGEEPSGRFTVRLANFEGPFDLLLQLISRHKLDVTEVALSKVTDEFMVHIRAMGADWDLDQTTEFLVVAATLLDLKAARLLPAAEVEDEGDLALLEARDLLFARLLQYRAYKEIAEIFNERLAAEAQRHPRTVGLEPHHAELLPEVVISIGPEGFAKLAVKAMQPKAKPQVYVDHIHAPLVSVREQAEVMVARLRDVGETSFLTLIEDAPDTLTVVARFLALLELYRERAVVLDQEEALGSLMVRWTGGEDGREPVVTDEFDQVPGERAAEKEKENA
ncbi:segregation/condensation protein A [Streptomyces sp. NPDC048639]|uniref:segregation/condensation protein A n=1 Tax=Streptomyces sp. NPDC048639 TaxID=3365581 RepID=UPI003723F01B